MLLNADCVLKKRGYNEFIYLHVTLGSWFFKMIKNVKITAKQITTFDYDGHIAIHKKIIAYIYKKYILYINLITTLFKLKCPNL